MRNNIGLVFGCVAAAIVATSGTAAASVITATFNFSASGFVDVNPLGATPPADPVSGEFTVTFDPMAGNVVDGALDQLSLVIDGQIFDTSNSGFSFNDSLGSDLLIVGGLSQVFPA